LPAISFHDLCHSAASLLLGLGVHPKVVQELWGHSQISMTLDIYSHVLPTIRKEAMERLTKPHKEHQNSDEPQRNC
jgi:site-specific recombinase XerD